MIAYEELEKALARWKTRRSGAVGAPENRVEATEDGIPSGVPAEGDATPAASDSTVASDSSGEMELGDAAILDES